MIESAPKTQTEKRQAPANGVVLVNAATNTFEFVINPKAVNVDNTLTVDDRRELLKIGIGNMELADRAKAVYAAGGKAKDIEKMCRMSLSYAKKMHMVFGRAQKGSKFKK